MYHDDRSYRKRRMELKLKKKGYMPGSIEKRLFRVDALDRTELL
jgi:hypothetical protein